MTFDLLQKPRAQFHVGQVFYASNEIPVSEITCDT